MQAGTRPDAPLTTPFTVPVEGASNTMSGLIPIAELPTELTPQQAVEICYRDDLDWIEEKLLRGLSTLIECDKQLVLYLYRALRARLKRADSQMKLRLIGGPGEEGGSIITNTVEQLGQAIFSGESGLVLAVPHLDVVVTTTKSGLSDKAREVVAMIYENPDVTILAFQDPSFEIPKAVSNVFTVRRQILGIKRDVLSRLLTQREARKFGLTEFNPFALYKYVSGLNAVRLREIMEHIGERLDFNPDDPRQTERLYREIRELTLFSDMEMPQVDLDRDIGGYDEVKQRIKKEILNLLRYKETLTNPAEIRQIEEIVPKGMLFVGPPGTGKTFFAKAMATALDATVTIVSGPELKSKWVGESEQNLRQVFAKSRKSAPAIIVFDEIDSFATVRGTYTGSGVEHSMVNQLLTEMDGFRKEELVFVVGTTNFPESLDPALLRPGRFELQIEIPYPDEKARKSILEIYRKKFDLKLSDEELEFLVQKTGGFVDEDNGVRYSGDHLYAICRALKREAIRRIEDARQAGNPIEPDVDGIPRPELKREDVLAALQRKTKKNVKFRSIEERTIAIHEAGHAILAHFCPHASHIERITIATGDEDTLGYVLRGVRENKYVTTRLELLDDICVLLGGRVAEEIWLGDISIGSGNDLMKATEIARVMIEELGMGDHGTGLRVYTEPPGAAHVRGKRRDVGDAVAVTLDESIKTLLDEQLSRARRIIEEHKEDLEKLVRTLLIEKTLHRADVERLLGPGASAPRRALDFLADLPVEDDDDDADATKDPDAGLGDVRAAAVPDRPLAPTPSDPEPPR